MAVKRLSPLRLTFISIGALAAWVSAGALSVASSQPGAARLGVLPSGLWLVGVLAIAVGFVLRSGADSPALLAISGVLLLPWLPIPVPAAFYIWVGHVRLWVWILIALALAAPHVRTHAPPALVAAIRDPRRAARLAAIVAALLYLAGAYQVSPQLPTGDEPHYLVIAESVLTDHDLKVENNYLRADYRAYFGGTLRPDYLRRGQNGEIYSIHAPGLSVMVAPVFALFGYPGVLALLAILSGGATGLAWTAAWRVTGDIAAAWFGWATVALSMPFFYQSFVAYPEAAGAAIIMIAVLTLVAGPDASVRRLVWTGAALAFLPWLHLRLAVAAGALGALIAIRQLRMPGWPRRAVALLAIPAVSAVGWLGFFYAVYGTFDPRAPYGGSQQSALANIPRGLIGLIFDQQFGALPNAPVYLCAALGLVPLFRIRRQLAAELLVVAVPYTLSVAAFAMWWGGTSSAARFLTPMLLMIAIPAAAWFQASRGHTSRVLGLGALGVSALITATIAAVDHGTLLYNTRDGVSRLLLWISPLADVTTGTPSLFQNEPLAALAHGAVWLAAVAFTALAGRVVAAKTTTVAAQAAAIGLAAAVSSMAALSIVWHDNQARPVTPTTGNVALLQAIDRSSHQIAIQDPPLKLLTLADVPPRLVIASFPAIGADAAPASDGPLIRVPHAPAATYVVDIVLRQPGAGRISIGMDREFGPTWHWDLAGAQGSFRREFQLPAPAAAMILDGDRLARSAIERVTLRSVALLPATRRAANEEPWHTMRYGSALVFLMDGGRAYAEPAGIWIAGETFGNLVITPDDPSRPISLFVRNPPVENHISIDAGEWRESWAFKPGEERTFDIPIPPGQTSLALRVTSAHGARPTEFERGSTDTRFLGCWIETR